MSPNRIIFRKNNAKIDKNENSSQNYLGFDSFFFNFNLFFTYKDLFCSQFDRFFEDFEQIFIISDKNKKNGSNKIQKKEKN